MLNQNILRGVGSISQKNRRTRAHSGMMAGSEIEALESRTLLSASAQFALLSTTGTAASPVYHYNITLKNTGVTDIGTFWFGWIPGSDLLPSAPLSESSPTGWQAPLVTGTNSASDGSAILWIANTPLTAGHALGGFDFSSPDSPKALAGFSRTSPTVAATESFVYGGGPESDAGFMFKVTQAPSSAVAASKTTLATSTLTSLAGDAVTLTATVASAVTGGATPTGTVTFKRGTTVLGTSSLTTGKATLTTAALPIGTDVITASYGGSAAYSASASTSLSEKVTTGKLVFGQQPLGTSAGKILNPPVTVKLENSSGVLDLAGNSNVTLTILTGPTGAKLAGLMSITARAVKGVATFPKLSLNKSGGYMLKAADGSLAAATSASFKITPGVAAKLVFIHQPPAGKIGKALLPAVTVAVEDVLNNIVTIDKTTLKIAIDPGTGPAGAILSGVFSVTDVNGVATFSDLILSKGGSYMLKVTDGKYAAAVSASFKVS